MSPRSESKPEPEIIRRRGVHYLGGRVRCPLAGVGGRPDDHCIRLVLDDDVTTVTVDRARRRIEIHNAASYAGRAVVADLTLLADGITPSGTPSPFALHLKVFKLGTRWSTDFHRHLRRQERMLDATYDDFEVTVTDGVSREVLLDRPRTQAMVRKPTLGHRIIKAFMAMRDHALTARQDLDRPGFAVVDFEMGFGRPPLAWMLVRARLISLCPARELAGTRSPAELLARGDWRLELTALSERWLPEVVKRDLVLFGLDDIPLLAAVRARGLRTGQTLSFHLVDGRGEVGLDGASAPLPGALDVARSYLEFHMLGGLLAEHTERFLESRR